MKWLGSVLSVLFMLSIVMLAAVTQGFYNLFLLIYAAYGGLFIYWAFKDTWEERWESVKTIGVVALIFTIALIIESVVLKFAMSSLDPGIPGAVPMFATPSVFFVISLGMIFVAVPAFFAFLDGLTKPDPDGLVRNPVLVFFYMLMTFGVYNFFWFLSLKKGLQKSGIETATLWWFMLPVVGMIIIYIRFSEALEEKTKRTFWLWFLIFFFLNGLDVVVNQAILNSDLKQG